jgi:membrane protease YdiL (CAAX protease family)
MRGKEIPMSAALPARSAVSDARERLRVWVARRPLPVFFALAFGLSWSFLLADALGERGVIPFRLTLSGPGLALTLLMSYGPTIAAMFVCWATDGFIGVKRLLASAVRWRVNPGWYALALAGPAALFFIAGRISEALGGSAQPLPAAGWSVLLAGVAGSLVRGVANGEEIGWRGYALPKLLQRHSALRASLMLGASWAAFHVPIMFMTSSVAGGQSFDTALPFFVGTLALSVLITWIYRSTGGSVLIIILLHGAFNAWPALIGDGGSVAFALQVLAALVIVVLYGPTRLARRQATA